MQFPSHLHLVHRVRTSGRRGTACDGAEAGARFTGGQFLLCCRMADIKVSMASRAVAPKTWILSSQALAAKPSPHANTQNRGAPATPSSRCRFAGAIAGLADRRCVLATATRLSTPMTLPFRLLVVSCGKQHSHPRLLG